MKKKEIATALGLSVALTVIGCGATNETAEPIQAEETVTVEPTEPEEVIETDTTAPEISAKKDIKGVDFGATIKPEDYAEAKDENEVSLFFVTESGDESELEIPKDLDISVKEINFTIVAVDSEGNRSKEITVTIPMVHSFSAEIQEKEEDKTKYELDEFTCDACGLVYEESALDDVTGEDLYDTELDKYTIEDVEKKMVTTQACNVRTGPSIEFEKDGSLGANEEVKVTGYCEEEGWYRIEKNGKEMFVSGKFLQDTKVNKPSGGNNGGGNSGGNSGGNYIPGKDGSGETTVDDGNGNCIYINCETIPGMEPDPEVPTEVW